MDQCLFERKDNCNGMLKDADLINDVYVQSVPYEFNFVGNKKRISLSDKIKNKTQDCIDKVESYYERKHEDRLLNQLYNGGDMRGISRLTCNLVDCPDCLDCKFSDTNRFQTAFYITREQNWDIIDTEVKVCWYEKMGMNIIEYFKIFVLSDINRCNYALFKGGNMKCCYKIEVRILGERNENENGCVSIGYKKPSNTKKTLYISNKIRFPEQFVNIMLTANGKNINISYTDPPNGGVCSLGSLRDNETMY